MKFHLPLFLRRNSKTSSQFAYIGEIHELSDLSNDATAVLLGQTVIMTLDAPLIDGSNAFIPQPTRESRRRDFSFNALRQPPSRLYSSVHPEVVRHIESQRTSRVILAADAIFALAARQKRGDIVLICNGYEARDQTYLDTYLFRHGQLVNITEAVLKPADHPRFPIDVKQHLDAALSDYPAARILWTSPLTPIELNGYPLEAVGPEMYSAKFASVTYDGKTTPRSPRLPTIVTLLTVAGCVGAGALDVNALAQKRAIYDRLTQQTPGSMPTIALEILQARADWQRETDAVPPIQRLTSANRLLNAVASNPDWRITRLSVVTQRGSETSTPPVTVPLDTAPLSITLTTPIKPNVQATDHAQPIVATLSQQTGTKLIVKRNAIAADTDPTRLRIAIDTENP